MPTTANDDSVSSSTTRGVEPESTVVVDQVESSVGSLNCELMSTPNIPDCWTVEQYRIFTEEYNWLYACAGKLGCTVCRDATVGGVKFRDEWSSCSVAPYGDSKPKRMKSLRKKIHLHKKVQLTQMLYNPLLIGKTMHFKLK